MSKAWIAAVSLVACGAGARSASAPSQAPVQQAPVESAPDAGPPAPAGDTVPTAAGDLEIIPVHHATVAFRHAGKLFVVDPSSQGDLAALVASQRADAIFITDVHTDHFDTGGIDAVRKDGTVVVAPPAVASQLYQTTEMRNGDTQEILGIKVEAVPMYNKTRGPNAKEKWHEKGRGNGYVFTFGDKRVYVSGDTECTPEMKALPAIDVAFVCMNLPYTMPPVEAAECVRAFKPKVVYPYHYKGQDPKELQQQVGAGTGIEVRLRDWY